MMVFDVDIYFIEIFANRVLGKTLAGAQISLVSVTKQNKLVAWSSTAFPADLDGDEGHGNDGYGQDRQLGVSS